MDFCVARPSPVIISTDSNAHHQVWGDKRSDIRGKDLQARLALFVRGLERTAWLRGSVLARRSVGRMRIRTLAPRSSCPGCYR
ncbi:hypothetical protein LAZ67_X001671, partial [Cordylochernes scorpioides]